MMEIRKKEPKVKLFELRKSK